MKKSILAISVIAATWGCGGNDLTRNQAAEILKQRFPPRTEWKLAAPVFAKGINDELWSDQIMPGTHGMFLKATPTGLRFIESIVQTPSDITPVAVLRKPVALNIDVTGITAEGPGENQKRVEFSWSFADQPREIEELLRWNLDRTTAPPWPAFATFQLYDDGWRLQKVDGVAYHVGPDKSFEIIRSAPFPPIPDIVETNLRKAVSAFKNAIAEPNSGVTFCNSAQDCMEKLPSFRPTQGIEFNLGTPMSGDHIYADAWRVGGDRKYSYDDASGRVDIFSCHGPCSR